MQATIIAGDGSLNLFIPSPLCSFYESFKVRRFACNFKPTPAATNPATLAGVKLRQRLSPSLVISCLALFVALGGTGYAVVVMPKDSVGTRQLKKNAVVSSKVRDGTLRARDFAPGQIPPGAQGVQGAPGGKGEPGASGFSSLRYIRGDWITLPPNDEASDEILCPDGEHVVGGGVLSNYNEAGDPYMTAGYVNSSFPPDTSSWFVSVWNPTDDPDFAFQAWAVCAPAAEVVYPN